MNCDLLFALANERNIPDSDKSRIDAILETDSNGIFLSDVINDRYSFSIGTPNYSIQFDGSKITIPANLLSTGANITVTVTDDAGFTPYTDYIINKVERKGSTLDTFSSVFTSKQIKNHKWSADSKVKIEIFNGNTYDPLVFNFEVVEYKDNWLIPDKVVFQQS